MMGAVGGLFASIMMIFGSAMGLLADKYAERYYSSNLYTFRKTKLKKPESLLEKFEQDFKSREKHKNVGIVKYLFVLCSKSKDNKKMIR